MRDTVLQQLLLWSGIGLALIALLTGLMGWWLAGRALAPVPAMTDIARRISEQHLHERLAPTGPGWRSPSRAGVASSPTPHTSCAPHWPCSAPAWKWGSPTR
ncbi:hypothetical protein [Streptomyces canus]|uniref:HAMP domain-containing protein n=1 Tax=Streptomyces canus TaxID=58343 RepID=UPI002DDA1901|nr:hypothetical protein [Streptomyces canus]WSD92501.1 hypothetical protein OG925_25155 [Streptomyces canus]